MAGAHVLGEEEREQMTGQNDGYKLGHAPSELERLDMQGRVLEPATKLLLSAAGVSDGMRVLDLGTGAGDVAFIAADLVGAEGSVLGIDRSSVAVERATARAAQRGLTNVEFKVGDIAEPAPLGPFDSVVGRLILMYMTDPAAVLRMQATQLRAGAVVAPIEFDIATARTAPPASETDRLSALIYQGFDRAGIDPSLGPKLWSVLIDAGLSPVGMLGVQPFFGPNDVAGPAIVAGITKTILPLMERYGVATAADLEPDTLQARLANDLAGARAVFGHPMLYCAWATLK